MPKTQYVLPNGKMTTNGDKMIKAWRSVIHPFCDLFGYHIYGFDPAFDLEAKDGSHHLYVPLSLAKKWHHYITTHTAPIPYKKPTPRRDVYALWGKASKIIRTLPQEEWDKALKELEREATQ